MSKSPGFIDPEEFRLEEWSGWKPVSSAIPFVQEKQFWKLLYCNLDVLISYVFVRISETLKLMRITYGNWCIGRSFCTEKVFGLLKIPLILSITANYFREFVGSSRDGYFSRTVQLIAKNSMKFEGMTILSEFYQLQSFLFESTILC